MRTLRCSISDGVFYHFRVQLEPQSVFIPRKAEHKFHIIIIKIYSYQEGVK